MNEDQLIEFGKLCANSANTNTLVKEMHKEQKEQDDRITDLEVHNSTIKKGIKWFVGGIVAIGSVIRWIGSN